MNYKEYILIPLTESSSPELRLFLQTSNICLSKSFHVYKKEKEITVDKSTKLN